MPTPPIACLPRRHLRIEDRVHFLRWAGHALGVTERTVRRDWQKGQLLLRAALE